MQLLHEGSDEGNASCLGVLRGRAARLEEAHDRPVPHMGWNTLAPLRSSRLLEGVGSGERAYFVHSYALPVSEATVATSEYGLAFSACIEWRNFFGVQFHPERSGAVGARILRNFLGVSHGAASHDEVPACG
jgi:glutamine amidotransferase